MISTVYFMHNVCRKMISESHEKNEFVTDEFILLIHLSDKIVYSSKNEMSIIRV